MDYYYTFIKENEYITISGNGEDPTNVKDLKWASSHGAAGVLKQMDDIKSVYSPTIGFVSVDNYKNNIYIQIAKFDSIYKNGWRFSETNIPAIVPESNMVKSEVLEKAKTKKRVYVKAAKGRKVYSRMQVVGREEIDPKAINNLWEIPLDQFKRLCTGDKILLKEHYIKHYMREYTPDNPHPQLEYLVSLMSDRMKDRHSPPIFEEFTQELSMHEKAVAQALGAHEDVPVHVLKDYPDLAYSYEIDISDRALRMAEPVTKYTRLCEMPKDEYDRILSEIKTDHDRDPKKITDKMLDYVYPEQLKDVKRAAKFRKKIFAAIPETMRVDFTPDTMNEKLHKDVVFYAKNYNLGIPDEVKAGYPTIFTDIPFTYTPTGDEECDTTANNILTQLRDELGDDPYNFVKMNKAVKDIISATGEQVPIICRGETTERESLSISMDQVSRLIGPDLMDKIKAYDGETISIKRDKNIYRAYGGQEIVLPERHGTDGNLKTISHEYGHSIEHMLPEIAELSHAFLNNRTESEPIRLMKDVLPGMGYGDSEETKPDGFMSAYIGKIYASDVTEILSMGMGYLTSPTDMWRMYEEDPEYFGFILAVVSGKAKGINPGSAHPWTKGETIEIDLSKLSSNQIKSVYSQLISRDLIKFEIPDELIEEAGFDPKKMSPDQLKAMFAKLAEKGLLKPKSGAPKPKTKATAKPEPSTGGGRPGLVKKKVTVKRGGKTFEQYRWVKAGDDEIAEKPKKGEEVPEEQPTVEPEPEKLKGPVIIGLNKPEGKEEPKKEEPKKEEKVSKMVKENVDSVESFAEMDIVGGINQDVSNIVKFKDGSKGIYKVVDKISDQGETNVAELQSILGWDNAPETIIDDFGKGDGSCQKWVENTVTLTNADPWSQDEPTKLEEKHYDDLSKIYLMDLITGNFDRHAGNIKLDKDGKVWAIDNDTWGSKSDYGTVIDEDFSMSIHHFWMGIDSKDDDQKAKFQTYVTKNAKHIVKNKEEVTKFIKDLAGRDNEFDDLYKKRTKKREEDEEIDYFIPKTHEQATGNMLDNLNKVIDHESEYKSWWSE